MLEKFRKISLITDYIDGKEQELDEYNEEHHIDSSIWVNGRRQTNLGVFRAYLVRYLRSLPEVSKELVCMVRHLQVFPSNFIASHPIRYGSNMKEFKRIYSTMYLR